MDSSGEATSTQPSPARSPAPFLSKTYDLLEAPGAECAVSWNDDGTAFVVSSPEELSRQLLPRYFKHCNFSSFIRQLNTYGFKKSSSDRWEFRHEKFRRGRRDLLGEIARRRCEPSIYPTFLKAWDRGTAASDEHRLVEENRLLREENSSLVVEIGYYRSLESELMERLSRCLRTYD